MAGDGRNLPEHPLRVRPQLLKHEPTNFITAFVLIYRYSFGSELSHADIGGSGLAAGQTIHRIRSKPATGYFKGHRLQ